MSDTSTTLLAAAARVPKSTLRVEGMMRRLADYTIGLLIVTVHFIMIAARERAIAKRELAPRQGSTAD